MEAFSVYKDMQSRTNGEIYIGVVGPVRTGKSTFIKKFMDTTVIPNIEDEAEKGADGSKTAYGKRIGDFSD